jgi:hypothetical protein
MTRLMSIQPEFVHYAPEPKDLEFGKLYISREYNTAIHLCACGCGNEVVTPLGYAWWQLTQTDDMVSLHPSIGNFQIPCKTHYFIRGNQIIWL